MSRLSYKVRNGNTREGDDEEDPASLLQGMICCSNSKQAETVLILAPKLRISYLRPQEICQVSGIQLAPTNVAFFFLWCFTFLPKVFLLGPFFFYILWIFLVTGNNVMLVV